MIATAVFGQTTRVREPAIDPFLRLLTRPLATGLLLQLTGINDSGAVTFARPRQRLPVPWMRATSAQVIVITSTVAWA